MEFSYSIYYVVLHRCPDKKGSKMELKRDKTSLRTSRGWSGSRKKKKMKNYVSSRYVTGKSTSGHATWRIPPDPEAGHATWPHHLKPVTLRDGSKNVKNLVFGPISILKTLERPWIVFIFTFDILELLWSSRRWEKGEGSRFWALGLRDSGFNHSVSSFLCSFELQTMFHDLRIDFILILNMFIG